jgi:hypothetical protein
MTNSISPSLQTSQIRPNLSSNNTFPIRFGNGRDRFQTNRSSEAKFGDGNEHGKIWESVKNFAKKATAITVGALSVGGLAIGVPLGLLQMAVGIFFHPLLITGALTMGIPLAGLIGSIWLGRK